MGPKQSFEIIFQQCLPFLRLDGYYLASDLTGVPDLFGHLRPALRSLVPGRQLDPDIGRLRPGVRLAVTAWALGTLAFVGWFGSVLVGGIPLLLETAWSLISSLGSATALNLRQGRVASAGGDLIQLLLVATQVLGPAILLKRVVLRPRRFRAPEQPPPSPMRRNPDGTAELAI